ncbi:MAG: hypothetical protein EOM77_03390 [Bacteroidia bacterium]|nr:hypothetical protein [Bacteroidia bacterium]
MSIKKPQLTYTEAHNKAVRLYRRTSIFLLWAGVVSVLATLIGVLRSESGYGMSLAFNIFILRWIASLSLPDYAQYIIFFAFSIASGAIFAVLGYFAQQGKKVFLFVGLGLYMADFVAVFLVYGAIWSTTYALTIGTHLFILGALIIAVFEYYQVITIEKHHNAMKNASLESTDDERNKQ